MFGDAGYLPKMPLPLHGIWRVIGSWILLKDSNVRLRPLRSGWYAYKFTGQGSRVSREGRSDDQFGLMPILAALYCPAKI